MILNIITLDSRWWICADMASRISNQVLCSPGIKIITLDLSQGLPSVMAAQLFV